MEPSTSLSYEEYISNVLTNFEEDQNTAIRVHEEDQESLICSLKQTHRHEIWTELNDFLENYRDEENIEKDAIFVNIETGEKKFVELTLRDTNDELIVGDLINICESMDDRKRGSYLTKLADGEVLSWVGIVRGSCNGVVSIKLLGGSSPEFDDTIHYVYKINNLTTSFRQWQTMHHYDGLNILDAKPQDYEEWKPKKDYHIYNKNGYDRCNKSQKKCYDIVGTHFKLTKPTIHMIFGPPGTGKTTTCIGVVLNILEGESKSKILYTTTCNSTIEKLMIDIYDQPMFHKHVPIVIGHSSRVGEKVQQYTLSSYVDRVSRVMKNISKIIIKGKILSKHRDVVTELVDFTLKEIEGFPIKLTTKKDSRIAKDYLVAGGEIAEQMVGQDLKQILTYLHDRLRDEDRVQFTNFHRILSLRTKKMQTIQSKLRKNDAKIPLEAIVNVAIIRMEDIKNVWWNRMDRKVTEDQIKHHSRLFLCTTSVAGSPVLRNLKIERVFIEEAAQTILVDSLIPITKHTKHLVLAGDPKQLQGMVVSYESEKSGYNMSLMHYFERKRVKNRVHQKLLLRTQYRMHPDISIFPNNHFYDGELIDAPSVVGMPTLVDVGLPTYRVINLVNTTETIHPKVMSYCNREEVLWIHKLLRVIQDHHPDFDFSRITIITPYSGQVMLFREILKEFITKITISSIDGIQGKENDVIIASLVRVGESIGFNNDRHRINVMLTRAKMCMYIVGNMSTFRMDPMWSRLIKNAKDRRVYDTQKMKAM